MFVARAPREAKRRHNRGGAQNCSEVSSHPGSGQPPADCTDWINVIAEVRDSPQPPWSTNVRFSVVGARCGPVAVILADAAPGPAGWMLVMLNVSGRLALAAACCSFLSANWAATPPIPPWTRLLWLAKGTLGSCRLLRRPTNTSGVGTSAPGTTGSSGSGALK